MRTETRQRVIEEEVYIADDGKEFDDEDDCKAYEVTKACENLKMYNYSGIKTNNVENCWYVKLDTFTDTMTFIEICSYDGVSHKGIDGPGVYMYTEGGYGSGNTAWTNISKIIEHIESEDTISGN